MGWLLKLATGNPVTLLWIAGGVFVTGLVVGGSAAWTAQGWRLDASKAEFAVFKAETKAAGEAAEVARQKDISDRKVISIKQEADNAKRYASLDARYRAAVAAARMSGNNSSSSTTESLSSAAAVISRTDRPLDLAGRLAGLEEGILGLLQRGDKAIERTITCKAWIDEQVAK